MSRPKWKHFISAEEKSVLENLYELHGVATDQLRRDQPALFQIARTFNRLTGRDESPSQLLRYMVNRRKQKDWPCLGSRAKKFEPLSDLLGDDELEHLRQIYMSLDTPSDEYLYRPKLARQIADQFENRTGVSLHANVLVAVIMAKRKRGHWVRIRDEFGDLKEFVDGA